MFLGVGPRLCEVRRIPLPRTPVNKPPVDALNPSGVGTPLSGGNLNRTFKAMLQRAELPKSTRFHDLRHTCATLLLKQGVHVRSVQELLGHADISLTLNVYSHVLPDIGDAAADAMDAALA